MPRVILTADWHVTNRAPSCRDGDIRTVVYSKLRQITGLKSDLILLAGDLFDRARSTPWCEKMLIELFGVRSDYDPYIFAVAGNHDLPGHNFELIDESSLGVMESARVVTVLRAPVDIFGMRIYPYHWGEEIAENKKGIALIHAAVSDERMPFEVESARELLRRTKFDLIVTGHTHRAFMVEHKGRRLVNPGSIWRMTADQADYQPGVYIWDTDDGSIVFQPLQLSGVVSRESVERVHERDARLTAFVERLKTDYEVGLSFEKNLEAFLAENKLSARVAQLVKGAVYGDGN